LTFPTSEVWTNIGQGIVTAGGTDAPSAGTVETWTVTSSVAFPTASSSASPPTVFYVSDTAAPSEMIEVTNTSGSTWTVTRGADNSTPVAHISRFIINQVVTHASLAALQSPNLSLQFLTGGGTITSATIASALSAGYQGIWPDSKYVWQISNPLVIDGTSNVWIKSDMAGSIGYNGVISYNSAGYINTGTAADGIQVYATSGTSTQGIIFEGVAFVGTNSNALIHFGGRERYCGMRQCFGYNTGTLSTTVASGSNGATVSAFTGTSTLSVTSNAGFPSTGQVFVTTTNNVPGLALITYTGTGSNTLTGCKTVAGAGTLTTGNTVAPPQAAVILDTAISGFNSEDQFFDHVQLASANGVALGLDLGSVSGHANDTSYIALATATGGGLTSIAAIGGGGHNFWQYYDRSASSAAPFATVWNGGATVNLTGGEDQNNFATGVAHLVSSGTTICTTRNLSVASNSTTAAVTGGTLAARGHTRWSGTVNVFSGVLDLSDPSGYYNNSGAGTMAVTGNGGTLVLAPAYASGGRPSYSTYTGATVNSAGVTIPRDKNQVAWTCDPVITAGATFTPISGTVYVFEFWLYDTETLTDIAIQTTTNSTLSSNENFAGVYTSGGTQIAVTADQTASWASIGAHTAAFTSAVANASPGRYYAALLFGGATMPSVRAAGGASTAASLANVNLSGASLRFAVATSSVSSLPAVISPSSFTQTSAAPFGCVIY
jgi:fibronectin-binding autotransporter adhesin